MTKQTESWKDRIEDHARSLEWQAAIARLLAMAKTPSDAIDAAGDIARTHLHAQVSARRRARGGNSPAPPAPVSKLLTEFAGAIREKLLAVGQELLPPERERLREIAPRVLAAVEAQDADVVRLVGELVPYPPEAIAWWIRAHLDIIERRFAS